MKAVTIPASEWADISLTTTQPKTANQGAKLKIQKKKNAPKRQSTSSAAAAIRALNIAAGGTKGQWGTGSAAKRLKPKPPPKPKPKPKPKQMPKRRPAPQQMQKVKAPKAVKPQKG